MLTSIWEFFVRLGFRLLYNELAWTYDAVSWLVSLGEWRRWQQAGLPYVTGSKVLEIGHGPGHMLLALKAEGHDVTGLDLSPFMGRQARRRLQQADQPARLIRGDVAAMPLATAVFDTILATFPTDYVIDPAALDGIHRLLRENGRFVVVPEGHLTGDTVGHRFIEWLFTITGQRSGPFAYNEDGRWPNTGVARFLQARFANAGFHLAWQHRRFPRSEVTILIATKGGGSRPARLVE